MDLTADFIFYTGIERKEVNNILQIYKMAVITNQ